MELKYAIETTLRDPIDVGLGTSLILEGWAFCAESTVKRLDVLFEGRKHRVSEWGNARQDVLVAHYSGDSPRDVRALRSGFWTVIPIAPSPHDRQAILRLVAELTSGETVVSASIPVRIRGTPAQPGDGPDARMRRLHQLLPSRPRVCICMTTYNPAEHVFRRQIESIRAQEYDNWVCIIQDDWSSRASVDTIRRVLGDDPRFIFRRNERNLGFYLNFEKVLHAVPPDCDLVCLCDQDDRWFPDKLISLIRGFRTADTTLVYSDMRIVDGDGQVVSDTFWSTRRNNYTDIETLFFANTITGAAAMFKASLLPLLLPFPPKRGLIYHDWWLGLVALAAGRIEFIDRPLYDYYQHGGNVVGWSHIGRIVSIRQFLKSDPYRRELAQIARTMYNYDCKFLAATIQALRLRVPDSLHKAALDRLSQLPQRPLGTLLGQVARAVFLKRASQNREKNILMAHAVMRMLNTYFTRKHRDLARKFATPEEAASNDPGSTARQVMPVDTFERKCAPLALDVRENEPPRVNIFLAMIDFKYFFGGYIGMFQLARHIAQAGFRVRFIIHEQCDFQPDVWRQKIQKYKGLEDIFDLVELEYRFDRAIPLPVSPHDRWVATSCWSAWLADSSARELGRRTGETALPFVFMIQEYEPYFVPRGSYYALSHAAYDLNLFGLFSTEILRDFFRQKRFGVYREGIAQGNARSCAFHNAVLNFPVDEKRLRQRSGRRKFLFYCRPEAHAQRNMFELGVLALRRAIDEGALDPDSWDFYGIGTVGEQFVVPLPKGAEMVALPKMSLEEYAEYLPDFDLGMSLMYTPHPSLVPLEMASAGLVTVTNSCENKTADVLRQISSNFEVGDATIEDLASALKRAEARIGDVDARIEGAAIRWPTSWDEAFAPDVMRPLIEELARAMPARHVQTAAAPA